MENKLKLKLLSLEGDKLCKDKVALKKIVAEQIEDKSKLHQFIISIEELLPLRIKEIYTSVDLENKHRTISIIELFLQKKYLFSKDEATYIVTFWKTIVLKDFIFPMYDRDTEKYYYVNINNERITDCIYDQADEFDSGYAKAIIENPKLSRTVFINSRGEEALSLDTNWHSQVSNVREKSVAVSDASIGGKGYIIDINGNLLTKCHYVQVRPFSEGLAYVSNQNGLCGFIDRDENQVIPMHYPETPQPLDYGFKDGVAFVYQGNSAIGAINRNLGCVIPSQNYRNITHFKDGYAFIETEANEFRYYNNKGQLVFSLKDCFYASSFSNGIASIYKKDGISFINKEGKIIESGFEPLDYKDFSGTPYDTIGSLFTSSQGYLFNENAYRGGGLLFVKRNSKYYLLDFMANTFELFDL